jgi:ketosteroid isomerase-like protein
MADRFVRLGWTLKHEFYAEGDSEPYEYLFEWRGPGEPVFPALEGRNTAVTSQNVQIVRSIYEAFARGDVPAAVAAMSPGIVWNEAEGFPYADGNPYVGPDAVLGGVFARLAADWDGFAAIPETFHDAGDVVLVQGRYAGVCKATGKSIDAPYAHMCTVAGGKATTFLQYTDTLAVARAMGL